MNLESTARRAKADGARWVVVTPSQWQADFFYSRHDLAQQAEYIGMGVVASIDEYIDRLANGDEQEGEKKDEGRG